MPRGPGEREVWRSLNGHEGESRIQIKADLEPPLAVPGGQGVHREVESEGHEEKYRAVIDGGYPEDELVGQRRDTVEPAISARAYWRAVDSRLCSTCPGVDWRM